MKKESLGDVMYISRWDDAVYTTGTSKVLGFIVDYLYLNIQKQCRVWPVEDVRSTL